MSTRRQSIDWKSVVRASTIEDMVLTDEAKTFYNDCVDGKILQQCIPSMILHGPPGTGKSSFFSIFVRDVTHAQIRSHDIKFGGNDIKNSKLKKFDAYGNVLYSNAGLNRGIDFVRHDVTPFCKTPFLHILSLSSSKHLTSPQENDACIVRKFVILDEADNLTDEAINALKSLMEECHKHCSFIFVCNDVSKMISPIRSRCQKIFSFPSLAISDMNILARKIMTSITEKLKITSLLAHHELTPIHLSEIVHCQPHSQFFAFSYLDYNLEEDEDMVSKICKSSNGDVRHLSKMIITCMDLFMSLRSESLRLESLGLKTNNNDDVHDNQILSHDEIKKMIFSQCMIDEGVVCNEKALSSNAIVEDLIKVFCDGVDDSVFCPRSFRVSALSLLSRNQFVHNLSYLILVNSFKMSCSYLGIGPLYFHTMIQNVDNAAKLSIIGAYIILVNRMADMRTRRR